MDVEQLIYEAGRLHDAASCESANRRRSANLLSRQLLPFMVRI